MKRARVSTTARVWPFLMHVHGDFMGSLQSFARFGTETHQGSPFDFFRERMVIVQS